MALPVYSTQFLNGTGFGSYVLTGGDGVVSLISCVDAHVGLTDGGGTIYLRGTAGQVIDHMDYVLASLTSYHFRGKIVLQPGETLSITAEATGGGENEFDASMSGDALTIP